MTLPPVGPGYGVALLPEKASPPIADWVEPNAPGVLAIGFDTENIRPWGSNRNRWFNAQGNYYDRPQREVSVHWNGREIANRLSPVSLTAPRGNAVRLKVNYVPGGAELTLAVDGAAVYDKFFVAEAVPYRGTLTFGNAQPTETHSQWSGRRFTGVAPVRVTALDKALNDAKHHRAASDAAFPQDNNGIGRVICTLTLGPTPDGLDPWDRLGHIWIYDESGEAYEVIRYITPYRKGWEWKVDVTDLLPLLKGRRRVEVDCETYAQGWLVSVQFDFYPGKLELVPYRVVNLWNGFYDVGNWDKTFADAVQPKTVATDAETIGARTRVTVTGHGQNEDDLGEFAPLWRRVHAGVRTWENTLWRTDVYLNPCRPQGGTWKFDRAGWAPGEVVLPWEIDLTPVLKPGQPLGISYELQPYRKKTEKSPAARHSFSSQLILYRKPKGQP
ncbi:MAG: peptide-N-glycosidase F-related protein [Armatimonadota bacterium]